MSKKAMTKTDIKLGPTFNPRPGSISLGDNSILDSYVVSKIRSAVYKKLIDLHGMEFAESNWQYWCHRILMAANVIRYPNLYSRAMDADQVKAMEKDFLQQLQLCKSIQEKLENGKSIDQIKISLGLGC